MSCTSSSTLSFPNSLISKHVTGSSSSKKRKAPLERTGPAAGTRSAQRRQGGSSSPSTGTGSGSPSAGRDSRSTSGKDSQETSNEPSAEQRQLDALLARLIPYAELRMGASIARREGHMVSSFCTSSHCLVGHMASSCRSRRHCLVGHIASSCCSSSHAPCSCGHWLPAMLRCQSCAC